jgi:hypothetical protein
MKKERCDYHWPDTPQSLHAPVAGPMQAALWDAIKCIPCAKDGLSVHLLFKHFVCLYLEHAWPNRPGSMPAKVTFFAHY